MTVTIATVGDYGVTAGSRTVTIPTSGSKTLTIATTDDQTDETDGSVTATLVDGSDYDLGTSKTATVTVADDDDDPPVAIQPVTPVLSDCNGLPTLSISSPNAVRGDAWVEFEVSLSCKPSSSKSVLLSVVRDSLRSHSDDLIFSSLSSGRPSITVRVEIRGSVELGLAPGWSTGLANYQAQGDVRFTD